MIYYMLDFKNCKLRPNFVRTEDNHSAELLLMEKEEFFCLEGDYPHRKNLRRGLSPVQYSKVEIFSNCIQGTMKVPGRPDKEISPMDFGFYMVENRLILLCSEDVQKLLLERIGKDTYGATTINQLLLVIFERLIQDDVLYLQELEERLSSVEEKLLVRLPEHFYEEIIRYRKRLSRLHSYYEQLMNIGDLMQASITPELSKEERTGWKLYTNRAERLHNHVEMLRDYLLQIRELYQSQIEVQQNKVMSFLTVVTTIFLPLTLIAGWYGMNFPGMPEFSWKHGYPLVIAVSLILTLAEIIYFKRKKMF